MKKYAILLIMSALLFTGCGDTETPTAGEFAKGESEGEAREIVALLAKFAPTEIGVEDAGIPEKHRGVIKKLVEAAVILDELFLLQVVDECPYTIEYTYSDNGKEFKGTGEHAFVKACNELNIGQKFTRIKRPQTNGKAERVIRTIMEMWHQQETFKDRKTRHFSLLRFINFYNTVKPHKGIDDLTPYEKLLDHFYGLKV